MMELDDLVWYLGNEVGKLLTIWDEFLSFLTTAYIYLVSLKFKLKGGKLHILFSCIISRSFDSAERLDPAIALKVRPLHELYLSTPLQGLSLLPFPPLHVSMGIFICGAAVPFARASSVLSPNS
jgi:hypothetical protein